MEAGPFATLPVRELRPVKVVATDTSGNNASCLVNVRIASAILSVSTGHIQMSSMASSSTGITSRTITNEGDDTLRFHTGSTSSTSGIALLNRVGAPIRWAEVKLQPSNSGQRVAVGGTTDALVEIAPLGSLEATVQFRPEGLVSGVHEGAIHIASNDINTTTVNLTFTVLDYSVIMLQTPERVVVTLRPDSQIDQQFQLYNVYAGLLYWNVSSNDNSGCVCNYSIVGTPFNCQLATAGTTSVGVETKACNGSIPIASSVPFGLRIRAPHIAGTYTPSFTLI
eukprot:COSAG05_NODE_7053_length_862_cov_1.057667_1_plen_281_part_01